MYCSSAEGEEPLRRVGLCDIAAAFLKPIVVRRIILNTPWTGSLTASASSGAGLRLRDEVRREERREQPGLIRQPGGQPPRHREWKTLPSGPDHHRRGLPHVSLRRR